MRRLRWLPQHYSLALIERNNPDGRLYSCAYAISGFALPCSLLHNHPPRSMVKIRTAARTVLLTLAAIAAPGAVSAQDSAAAGLPPQANEWLAEIQQIHVQLAELQERALQDPDLAARRDSLGNHIRVAMETIDPSLSQSMGRIEEMERQAAEAEAQSDSAKLTQLRGEAQQIEQQFIDAQQQALQLPDLAAEVTAFQQLLQEKILATSADAPRLLARFQELEQKLTELADN
jgi:hypothetical protein